MTTKKFLSLALTSTLALSMAAPAFAADDVPSQLSFDYTGETWTEENVVIDVSMPTATSGNIILNPYQLNYVDESSGSATVATHSVIAGKLNYVENNSSFPIDIAWEITGTASGGVNFVEKAPAATATTKDVYLPIVLVGTKAKAAPASGTANVDSKLKAVKAETQASTEKTVLVLDGAADTTHLGSGDPLHFMCFGIDGANAALNNGTKLEEKWTAEDTVSVSMIFNFSKHV